MNDADDLQTLYRIVEHAIGNLRPGGMAVINQTPVWNAQTERTFRVWCAFKGVEIIEFRSGMVVVRRPEVPSEPPAHEPRRTAELFFRRWFRGIFSC